MMILEIKGGVLTTGRNVQYYTISHSLSASAVDVRDYKNSVIPAQTGIQTKDVNPVFLDPRFRGVKEK